MSICGADCTQCGFESSCKGCEASDAHPFGEPCMVADHCRKGTYAELWQEAIAAFNALGIADLPEVTELYALRGAIVNPEYTLPGGQKAKLWNDDRIYLGNQLPKRGSNRCYGIAADEKYLMVSEYCENGADPEIVVFKRRK